VADIFLSYKREDRERAQRVERALTARGWDVFWDTELLPGVAYRAALAQEIARARCVVVLWSFASVESEFVMDEATRGKGKLVSARIDEVEVPLGFGQGHLANLVDWSGDASDPSFELLVQGIAAFAPLPQEAPQADTPEEPKAEDVPAPVVRVPKLKRLVSARARARYRAALRPTLLLAAVFAFNWIETGLDPWLTPASLGAQAGYPITEAFRWFEGYLSFASHDATSAVATYGYTFSYFFVLPLVCLFVVWSLARREDPRPYRALSLAVAIDYAVSLPFFLFFPVPERWAYFESEAMLLSDKWSDRLIEAIRPISGLDNSFPSTHVSLIVLAATACFLFAVPFRKCTIPLGGTVVLSTFVLGIHWLPDMLAGVAVGIASMLLAWRLTRAGRLAFLWGQPDAISAASRAAR
jgi:membrane-associated phospholipid phosphatase